MFPSDGSLDTEHFRPLVMDDTDIEDVIVKASWNDWTNSLDTQSMLQQMGFERRNQMRNRLRLNWFAKLSE
jgi:hypothetical protein